ncbi:MAG: 2'-5' RNA ligase family protein [Cyclobacteriaceae bacterium]|jgi:2'-5' RNA ligase|nr:2'-5' RNA ligase family protein [Cyclobacteriaceae bacterium]MDH4296882.1 2'-5' RNA ligase family protein [Cyclobacteriaceae bacterium]MDH5247390.1 2'-5' RNA ligase family protein [Cyclobacteriaceae bacterium]
MNRLASPGKAKEKLYFIAIVPPTPIYEEALQQKEYFKDNYNSKASLNSPPHITLHMPFRWKENEEAKLFELLAQFTRDIQPVAIKLDNFSSFPPRVIFINVEMSPELETLQRDLQRYCRRVLNLFNANYRALPFKPHLTVAFRDLKKPNFLRAWDEFRTKDFHAEFIADKVTLLKHSGRVWKVHQEFTLR